MMYRFMFLMIVTMSIYCCNKSGNDSATKTVKVSNRATLGAFWNTFQKAVVDRDIETIESLYDPSAVAHKFTYKEYQEKIAASSVSDVISIGETYKGKKVYQFQMVFPPENLSNDEENEESTTTIFIWVNDNKEYEIFNVLEAG